MGFITFDARFVVGHPDIDRQHAGLFDMVNQLHEAMRTGKARQEIATTLGFLKTYTVEHFQTEERLMEASGYPGYEAHKDQHDALTRQVIDLEARYLEGSLAISITLMDFLRAWLTDHIANQDQQLARFLKDRA